MVDFREWVQMKLSIYWAARAPHVFPEVKDADEKRVLDLGCNRGRWSRQWQDFGAKVTGVDYDIMALRDAQSQSQKSTTDTPVYVNASAECLPFQTNSFYAAICLDVLDIVPKDFQAAKEICRVLKPGGRLVMTVISRNRRQYFMKVAFAEHIRNYTREELRSLLLQAGFTIHKEFTFYRRIGGFARELGAWIDKKGLGKIPIFNVLCSLVFTGLTYLDGIVPEHPDDGGFGFVAAKADLS